MRGGGGRPSPRRGQGGAARCFRTMWRIESVLGPVDPLFWALSGLLKFAVRRHKFNKDSLSFSPLIAVLLVGSSSRNKWPGGAGLVEDSRDACRVKAPGSRKENKCNLLNGFSQNCYANHLRILVTIILCSDLCCQNVFTLNTRPDEIQLRVEI